MRPPFPPGPPGEANSGLECGPHAALRGLFGRHRGGPFARWRGPRMFDSGALRFVVLGLIEEEPRHDYDIIRGLKARFQGSYSPSPGSIYPTLQQLEEADLVVSTTTGRAALHHHRGRPRLSRREPRRARQDQRPARSGVRDIGEQALGEAIQALRGALFAQLRKGALTPSRPAGCAASLSGRGGRSRTSSPDYSWEVGGYSLND